MSSPFIIIERLGNGPLKAGRFLGFIVGEGEDELLQPGVTPPVALVARAGAMRHGRGQQRVEKLLGSHRLELHLAEQPLVCYRPFAFVFALMLLSW